MPPLEPVRADQLPSSLVPRPDGVAAAVMEGGKEGAAGWDGFLGERRFIVAKENVVLGTDGSLIPPSYSDDNLVALHPHSGMLRGSALYGQGRYLEALDYFEAQLRLEEKDHVILPEMARYSLLESKSVEEEMRKRKEERAALRQKYLRLRISDCYVRIGRFDKSLVRPTQLSIILD